MRSHQLLLGGGGVPLITVDAAEFDGTNDYLYRATDFSGNADGTTGIFSCWARFAASPVLMYLLCDRNASAFNECIIYSDTSRYATIYADDSGGTDSMSASSSVTQFTTSVWYHILMAWDTSTSVQMYVNDVSQSPSVTITAPFTINYAKVCEWAVGAAPNGAAKFNGSLAEMYFAPGQYLDISKAYNRRKFLSSSAKPVWLGSDGSAPTGTAPLVYLHLDNGETAANFATNRGTGGNFTVTGALATSGTSPSD